MNKQQYRSMAHNFRERRHHIAHVNNFPMELQRDALGKANINHKLSDLRDLILDCKNIIDNTL